MPIRRQVLLGMFSSAIIPAMTFRAAAADVRPGGLTSRDNARKKFGAAVANSYGVDPAGIVVQPQDWGLPDNPFDALAVGDMRAFRADFMVDGNEASVFGFASTGYAPAAFPRFLQVSRPGGIASLMEACGVLSNETSVPLAGIVERLAWVYPGYGTPVTHPSADWTLTHTAGGAEIVYITRTDGRTGLLQYWKIIVSVAPDFLTAVTREELAWP